MGTERGGRPQKPTALKVLHGDRKDRINDEEPVPAVGEVAPPQWVSPEVLPVWSQYAPDLAAKGVLTAWDVEAFAVWCDAVVRRRRAVAALEVEGEVVDLPVFNKNGDQTGERRGKNPWTLVLNEADAQVQRYGARFGLTPSDRSQLRVGEGRRDPQEDLLSG